ncbi:NAD-dependent epimerase/dehydratase family protein, partial [Alicyclobacillus fodiniaquatilis]
MKILVTGGTGLLGDRLISKLVKDGHEIFALTRSASSHAKLRAMGATPIDADLESSTPFVFPLIDAVVHAAALFRFSGPREPFFRTNVDGTAALLKAAESAGAKTFIYISAAGIIMDNSGTPIRDADESAPTFPNHFSAYLASKAQAEPLVLAANKTGFRTIALRPPTIWGPGDLFSRALPEAVRSGQ